MLSALAGSPLGAEPNVMNAGGIPYSISNPQGSTANWKGVGTARLEPQPSVHFWAGTKESRFDSDATTQGWWFHPSCDSPHGRRMFPPLLRQPPRKADGSTPPAQTPGVYSTDFTSNVQGKVEHFDVYGEVQTRYSQVHG